MLPNPQPSLTFTQQPKKVEQENKVVFSSSTSVVSKPKGLMQRLYSYLRYGMYSLRYFKQQLFSQNESFVIDTIPFTADLITYSTPNQSHFSLENQINFLHRMDLNIRMIDAQFTPKSANTSFIQTNHALDIQGLIPWAQLMWHYFQKSNVTSLQNKKIDSAAFFKDSAQTPANETSFPRRYTEKNISMFKQG